jgi:hypothetical protein
MDAVDLGAPSQTEIDSPRQKNLPINYAKRGSMKNRETVKDIALVFVIFLLIIVIFSLAGLIQ